MALLTLNKTFWRKVFRITTRNANHDLREGLKVVLRIALRYKRLMLCIFSANVLAALCEGGTIGILALAVSVLVQDEVVTLSDHLGYAGALFDDMFSSVGSGGWFLLLVITAVCAQILKSSMTYLGKYFAIRLQASVSKILQEQATDHVMSFSYKEICRHPAGALSAYVGQTSELAGLINQVNTLALASLMLITYTSLMLLMSLELTLAALLVIIALSWSLKGISRKLKALGDITAKGSIDIGKVTFEYFNAPRLLRVFDATSLAGRLINESRAVVIEARRVGATIKATLDPAIDALTITGAGFFLITGYLAAGESARTVIPKLLLFLLVLNRLMPQVKTLNTIRFGFASARHSIEIVARFLATEGKTFQKNDGVSFRHFTKEIRFSDVTFSYPDNEIHAVSTVNFVLKKGNTLAIVGQSGSGKSTLVDLLLGLQTPQSGTITVDGHPISSLNPSSWLNLFGVVDQEVFLINASIRDNIAFANTQASQDDIIEAAKTAYAHDFINILDEGYDTIIGDRGHKLSGGQQQRIVLARALLRSPEILILDEATSSLDTKSEQMIQNSIDRLSKTHTIIIIAHRLSTIARADHIIVLDGGIICEQGAKNSLLNKRGHFHNLWTMQHLTNHSN